MELREYAKTLLKWWWLILASVAVSTVSSYFGTQATPPTYLSRTTLMVGQALQDPNPSQSEFYTGQALAQTYADLAKREPVLRATLTALELPWEWSVLHQLVSTRIIAGTQLLEITVLDSDPLRAQVLASEIAHQLILQSPAAQALDPEKEEERLFVLAQIETLKTNITGAQTEMAELDQIIATANSARQIQDARNRQQALQLQVSTWQATYAQLLTNLQQGTPNYLSVVEPAQLPAEPVGPNLPYNIALAAAIGLVLSGGAAFLLEYLDDTVKTPDDVRKAHELAALGGIARMNGEDPERRLITLKHPRSPIAEAYRVLRTGVQFAGIDTPRRTLLITSASAGEGKTTTAANLAIVMAQAGHRVVLIDSDLRRPMLHRYFDLANFNGLTNALLQLELAGGSAVTARQIEAVLQPTPVDGLRLLTSGPLPPNPSELLGSAKMRQLLGALATTHDYVILDSPPVLAVTDAVVLATQVDAVLFVVDSGATRQGAYHQSIERLVKVGAHLVGVALNRLSRKSDGYYYYYHYDYRYSGSDADGKGRSNGHGGSSNGHGTEATPLRPESKRSLLQRRR